MIRITPDQLQEDIAKLADQLSSVDLKGVYGIPRGGSLIAVALAEKLKLPVLSTSEDPLTLIVDDLVDTGVTLNNIKRHSSSKTATLYIKPHSPEPDYYTTVIDDWIEFYYEDTQSDIESNVIRILEYIGENPNREGLLETPKRYIKFLTEFTKPQQFQFTTFDGENYDEMIIQKDIPFFSLCEHHLAPFFGTATVAYIPNGKIVGLSKLTRTVELYSRRLQNQERITQQIAQRLEEELHPKGVAVKLTARHFCMEMRGVRTHDVFTTTSKMTGSFKDNDNTRNEFLELSK